MRNRYLTICSKASSLVQLVASDQAWAWANNVQNIGELERAVDKMQGAMADSKCACLLQPAYADLKRTTAEEQLTELLTKFLAMEPLLAAVEGTHAKLLRRFKAG